MDIKDFENSFHVALCKLLGEEFNNEDNNYIFELITDIDENRHYTSKDDYNLPIFKKYTEVPLVYDYVTIYSVLTLFAKTEQLYPISVELSLKESNTKIICLKLDLRYRKANVLKNQETGHPPFKVIR